MSGSGWDGNSVQGLWDHPWSPGEPNPFRVPHELGTHLSTGEEVVGKEKLVAWPSEGEGV